MDAQSDQNPPGWLVEALERSEAQIEAGRTEPLETVLDRLRASIARMQSGPPQSVQNSARRA
jgi:hypothetical protein